jgi:hypothetical protein
MNSITKKATRSLFALSLVGFTMSIAPMASAQVSRVSSAQLSAVQVEQVSLDRLDRMSVKQRDGELKRLNPHVRRRILKYLACRFGPQGESRQVCAGQAGL